MAQTAATADRAEAEAAASARRQLSELMRRVSSDIGADRYMLAEMVADRGPQAVRIIACSWIFDALEEVGTECVARIIESGHAAGAGIFPKPLLLATFLPSRDRQALRAHGHEELYCRKLVVRDRCMFALFSSEAVNRIDPAALSRAHMKCCYGVDRFLQTKGADGISNPLSDRERECLHWVSEGKTTDEIALILGVSSNTVNSYIAHAIQKFGANNRAMAIATAIRSGII